MTSFTQRFFGGPGERPEPRSAAILLVLLLFLIAATVFALFASRANGQTFEQKLWQQDANYEDEFGRAVCMADGTVVLGEPAAEGVGMVSTYARIGPVWTHLTSFQAPDAMPDARFGASLWLEGDTLVVGAPFDGEHGPEAGAVYVFERGAGAPGDPTDDRWTMTAKLYPSASSVPTHFGHAVSLQGGWLIAGAPGSMTLPVMDVPSGAAVFVRDDQGTTDPLDDLWIEQAWLLPATPLPNSFGVSLLMLPGAYMALVGEPVWDAVAQGSVRIVYRDDQGTADPLDDTWADVDQVTGRDVGSTFGATLAFDGSTLLVGGGHIPADPEPATEFVGVYRLDDAGTPTDPWDDAFVQEATLGDPPGSAYGGFGDVLAVSEGPDATRALVNHGGWIWGPAFHGGRVRVFERVGGEWLEQPLVQAPDEFVNDGFGCSMVLEGDLALFGARGAPYNDYIEEPPVEGAAWVLDFATPSPWSEQAVSGAYLRFGGWGRLEDGATVSVRHYGTWLAQTDIVLVIGFEAIWAPFKGITMVPQPTLLVPLTTGDNGDVLVSASWPRADLVPSGTGFWFQVWMAPLFTGDEWRASQALLATQP